MKMADEQGDPLRKTEQSLPDWNTFNDSLTPPIDIIHQKLKKDKITVADPVTTFILYISLKITVSNSSYLYFNHIYCQCYL